MKKRNNLYVVLLLLLIVSLGSISLYLYMNNNLYYILIPIVLLVISVIVLVGYLNSTKSKEKIYSSYLKNIIKTYDSILVKTKDIPDFNNKEVVRIDYFEDLVSAQEEVKKPIFYINHEESTSFVLIDNNIVCTYFLKIDETKKNPVEDAIETAKIKDIYKNADESIFDDIDNTTIIKFSNNKSYRVSPIRKIDGVEVPKDKNREIKKVEV